MRSSLQLVASDVRIKTLVVVVLALFLTSCGAGSRPPLDQWRPTWIAMLDLMPTADELGDPPDREVCSDALGDVRTARAALLPTPDPAIDPVVREWIEVAEDILFECPPSSPDLPDLTEAYAQLARLEAEVRTVLQLDPGS